MLFIEGRVCDIIVIWFVFFMNLLVVYSVFSWFFMMLVGEGFSLLVVVNGFMVYNIGGVFGVLLCVVVIGCFGLCVFMLFCCLVVVGIVFVLCSLDVSS